MTRTLFILLLIVSMIAESSLVSFPFFLIASIMYFLYDNSLQNMMIVFMSALALDVLVLSPIGSHALFIFITFFVMTLYKKSYESDTVWFLIIFGLLAILFYQVVFSYPFHILLFSMTIGLFMVFTMSVIARKNRQSKREALV